MPASYRPVMKSRGWLFKYKFTSELNIKRLMNLQLDHAQGLNRARLYNNFKREGAQIIVGNIWCVGAGIS